MSLVRSQLNKKPMLCKSSTEYDAKENRLLEREFQILNGIYDYYDLNGEEKSFLLPASLRSSRLPQDSPLVKLVPKRIPFPISIQKLENRNALLFADTGLGPIEIGGTNPTDIMNGVKIGLYIAQALDILHRSKVIHLNVCPETILAKFNDDNEVVEALLFDYRISIEIGKDSDIPISIDENIRYISPEQTGRLDKSIDTRSDVYSLGITLWEIIVGKHPFEDVSDDEIVYSHIAKVPELAHKANPLIPTVISTIIAKMMRKEPSERYQTMGAVIHDLEAVVNHFKSHVHNESDFLTEMQKLELAIGSKDYHREIRMNGLISGFDHLVTRFQEMIQDLKNRPSEVVLLKGAAKSGKLTLVQQFQKVLQQQNGHLFVAKIAQHTAKTLYASFVTAIDVYLKYLMCRPDMHLANFRNNIQKKMTKEGISLLTHFFPTIKIILGNKQVLKAEDHQIFQRFVLVVEQFLKCIAQEDSPAVFYIGKCSDNDESLSLIHELIVRGNTHGIMYIFDVVDVNNDKSFQSFCKIPSTKVLEITPLTEKEVSDFLSQCICPPLGDIAELAKVLCKKSLGNPFYLKEHLLRCQEQKLITFDEFEHGWSWDIKEIEERLFLSENVVNNVMSEIEKLDSTLQETLSFASLLGQQFDRTFIQRVIRDNPLILLASFESAQKLGIIRPISLVGKREMTFTSNRRRVSIAVEAQQSKYEFIHSSVRDHFIQKFDCQNNINLLLEAIRIWPHECVGCDYPKALLGKLNQCIDFITKEQDLEFLFDVNCELVSKHSLANPQELLATFMAIEEIIGKCPGYFWTNRAKDVFDIKIEATKCYLLHQGNEAVDLEGFETEMSKHATRQEDQLQILKIHLKYLLKRDLNEAMEYSANKLALVCDLDLSPDQIKVLTSEINTVIRNRTTQDVLADMHKPVEPKFVLIQEILSMLAIANRDTEETLNLLALHSTSLALKHGFSSFCSVMIPLMMRYYISCNQQSDSFLWWSEFCTKLLQEQAVPDISVMTRYIARKGMTMVWSTAQSLEFLQKTWLMEGYLLPDMEFRLYETYIMLMVSSGRSLNEIQNTPKDLGSRASHNSIEKNVRLLQTQIISYLSKKRLDSSQLFSQSSGYLKVFHCCIYETWSHTEDCFETISKIEFYWSGTPLQIDLLLFHVYLITSSQHDDVMAQKVELLLKRIDELVHLSSSRENACKHFLAKALTAQFNGQMNEAIKHYELSIDNAIESKNTWVQAWASELQANYWSEQGLKRLATPCYISSFQMWTEWGSTGKVSELKMKQPLLVPTVSRQVSVNSRGRALTKTKTFKNEKEEPKNIDIDLSTIIKVTNSLSNEKNLNELMIKLMTHLMTNTGATKTVIMLSQGAQLFCNATAYLDSDGKIKNESVNQEVDKHTVPVSIVYYVLRSGEAVVHNDSDSTRYDQDEYLDIVSPKSIFCCPIKHQDDISGVLYLENKSQQGTFTQGRCQLVESLMSSVSISIANMKLTQLNQELSKKLSTTKKEDAPKFKFDAPITKVLGELQGLKERFLQEGDAAESTKLDEIIAILNSDSLFTAQFDHVNDENGDTLDQETRSWLQSTLQHRILVESNSAKNSLTNVKLEPDPIPDPSDPIQQYQVTPYADFDMFHYSVITQGKPLYYQCMHMIRKYKIQDQLPIPEMQARSYFQKIELEYHNLPYHNSTHAADLLKSVEALLLDTELAVKFSSLEVFGMIVAGAVHDMDHPGVNNQFLVTIHHPVSILYNDISVLENHHVSRAFDVAMAKESNLFAKLKVDQFVLLRKNVIQLVLATDLTQHFQIINKFKQKIQNGLKLDEPADRALCMEMCIKLGDLNNPTKPFVLSQKWAVSVMQEFFLQGDRERSLGFPISKFMDRHDTCIPKCQLGFIDVLVTPLYDAWLNYHSSTYVKECIQHLIENRERWKQMPENALEECKSQQWISLDETLDMLLPHVDFGQYSATSNMADKQKRIWSMTAKGEDAPSRYFGSGIKSVEAKTRPTSLPPPRLSTRQRSTTSPGPVSGSFLKIGSSGLANCTSIESFTSSTSSKMDLAA